MNTIITFIVTIFFYLITMLPGFLMVSLAYTILAIPCYFILKHFFVFNKKWITLFFITSYIIIFIGVGVFVHYPKLYEKVDGVLVDKNGPVSGVLVTRNMQYINEKVSLTTDKNGKVSFPSKRGFRGPLSTEFSEEYVIKYKNEDLSFRLSMPYTEPTVIETEYGYNGSTTKFKLNIDNLYTFSSKQTSFSINNSGGNTISLLNYIVGIYTNKNYSNGREASCTKTLVNLSKIEDYKIDRKACPDMYDFEFFAKPYNQTTLQEYVVINDFFNNSKPVEKYLATERDTASSSEIYKEIYSRFVYAKTVNDMPDRLNGIYEMEYGSKDLASILNFDFMKVSSDVDLVIVGDISSSGAYNFADQLYQITFTKDGIDFSYPMIINDLTHYSRSTDNLAETRDVKSEKYVIDLTNSYFNHDYGTFNIYGFKLFGQYPCNIINEYSFINNRLILINKKQAKDCIKYDIQALNDITEDFDNTPIEIYRISPSVLEKAKQIKI